MNMYERATSLKLRLDTSRRDDQSQQLLNRATSVREQLRGHVAFLNQVVALREVLALESPSSVDRPGIRRAVGGLRAGLTRDNAGALQQQAAMTLLATVDKVERNLTNWTQSAWRLEFGDLSVIVDEDNLRSLVGARMEVTQARRMASQLRNATRKNPIRDIEAIEKTLGVEDLAACVTKIRALGGELRAVLHEIERGQAELSPEVRGVLDRGASDDGFPLEDMTDELLSALREVGMLGELVVRRRM